MRGLQPGDPERIGPYLLLGRLGQGGLGLVFLGQSADGRPVAVKVIRPDLAADSEFRARFRREVTAATKGSGPSTAEVVDADAVGPQPWLATAYVAGVAGVAGPSPAEGAATRPDLPAIAATAGPGAGQAAVARTKPSAGRTVLTGGAVAIAAAVAVTLIVVTIAGHSGPPRAASRPAHPALAHRPTPAPVQLAAWSAGQRIGQAGSFASLSCPAATFCLAADSGGNVYTYSGGRWAAPQRLASSALTSVSCATASFCAATGPSGRAYVYADGRWSAPSQLAGADGNPADLRSVSCPAPGICLAAGKWDAYTYSAGTWATGDQIQQSHTFASLSCPAATFCLAADSGGNVYTYSGGRWAGPQRLASSALTSVSCATASFCAATGPSGRAYVYADGRWSAPRQLVDADGNPADLRSVSCPAPGICLAVGKWDAYTYSAGTWAAGHFIQKDHIFTSISCPGATFCVAADTGGNMYTYSAG